MTSKTSHHQMEKADIEGRMGKSGKWERSKKEWKMFERNEEEVASERRQPKLL